MTETKHSTNNFVRKPENGNGNNKTDLIKELLGVYLKNMLF
jgi:hypothetical protein